MTQRRGVNGIELEDGSLNAHTYLGYKATQTDMIA